MKRSIALILALLMVMTLVLTGCGSKSTESAPVAAAPAEAGNEAAGAQLAAEPGEPQYGGEAVFYYDGFNTVFDPAMGEQYTYSLWLENLFGMDWGLNDPTQFSFQSNTFTLDSADGQIAKEWTWDPETCDFTVTIRDDIYFQEKAPEYDIFHARNLTAADVKYSYDRVLGTGSGFDETNYVVLDADWRTRNLGFLDPNYSASGEPSDEAAPATEPERDLIEVIDDYTLVFHMASNSETKLSEFIIAQINITGPEWDTLTDEQKLDWHYACGTGPYVLTEYVADNHFTFERNENYYDYDERHPENKLPYIDKVTLQKFGDTTTILSSFFAGNLDFIGNTANLSTAEAQQLKDRAAYVQFDYPGMAQGLGLKCNQEPFSDLNVRIAMQKAINMQEVSQYHFGQETLVLPSLWDNSLVTWCATADWTPELLDEYSYDPEGAEALLDAAGYPKGADGTRFTFTVALDPSADMELFQLAKGYFANVGINMEIEVLSDMAAGREVQSGSNAREDTRQFNFMIGGSTDAGFSFQSYATTGFAYCSFADDYVFDELLLATRDANSPAEQAAAAKAADLHFVSQHTVIALSGAATTPEYYSARIGGNENGEFLSASHFFKTIMARLWVNE